MKARIFTRKSAIRHLIMLGIMIICLVLLYVLAKHTTAYKELLKEMAEEEKMKKIGHAATGPIIGIMAMEAAALYWIFLKVMLSSLKKAGFSWFGWLPGLRKIDPYTEREQEEYWARKRRRAWDRENPIIKSERVVQEDENGFVYSSKEDVLQNPVEPVREEIKAFFKNVIKRIVRGAWGMTVALGVPALSILVGIILWMMLVLLLESEYAVVVGISIAMSVVVVAVYIVHPIITFVKKPAGENAEPTN